MAYNRNQARPLLTKAEYELFASSLADRIGSLTAAQIRAKVDRARSIGDKYRDLFRRQSRSTRERTGAGGGVGGTANTPTDRKARIFAEALGRFEARLAKVEAEKARSGKPKTPRPRASARSSSKKVSTRADRRTARSAVRSRRDR